jgi:hypothetical protein
MTQSLLSHKETNFKELAIRFGVICTTLYRVFDDGQKRDSKRPQNRGNRGGESRVYRFAHIRENNAAMGLEMALESMFKISFGFTV